MFARWSRITRVSAWSTPGSSGVRITSASRPVSLSVLPLTSPTRGVAVRKMVRTASPRPPGPLGWHQHLGGLHVQHTERRQAQGRQEIAGQEQESVEDVVVLVPRFGHHPGEPPVLLDDLLERQIGHHAGYGEGELVHDLVTPYDDDAAVEFSYTPGGERHGLRTPPEDQ